VCDGVVWSFRVFVVELEVRIAVELKVFCASRFQHALQVLSHFTFALESVQRGAIVCSVFGFEGLVFH